MTSSIPCGSDKATVEIKVWDETKKGLKLKSLQIEFHAGDGKDDLFKQPKVDKDGKVTDNTIGFAISPEKRFKVKGSEKPTTANDAFLFVAYCTDESLQELGKTLTITFTGVTNATAGKANISIAELLENRGDDVPKTDVEQLFEVIKK